MDRFVVCQSSTCRICIFCKVLFDTEQCLPISNLCYHLRDHRRKDVFWLNGNATETSVRGQFRRLGTFSTDLHQLMTFAIIQETSEWAAD
jgi:hypothetical protein